MKISPSPCYFLPHSFIHLLNVSQISGSHSSMYENNIFLGHRPDGGRTLLWNVVLQRLYMAIYISEGYRLHLLICILPYLFKPMPLSDLVSMIILAYFTKINTGLSNHQPVFVCLPLIIFGPIGIFSWNLVARWCHWRLPRCYIFNLVAWSIRKWRTFKLLGWVQRNTLITFEPIGGFGWNVVWRWWHWISFTVRSCRESWLISSSHNFLLT
jgi:hypothetical protein